MEDYAAIMQQHHPLVREIHHCRCQTSQDILATAVQQNQNVQLNYLRWNVSFASSDFLAEVLCLVIVFCPVIHAVKQIFSSIPQHKNTEYINQIKAGELKSLLTICSVSM